LGYAHLGPDTAVLFELCEIALSFLSGHGGEQNLPCRPANERAKLAVLELDAK
jgi:hypothetical protein